MLLEVTAYETEAEQLNEELMREGLLTGTGEKESYEVREIYARHSRLFEPANVRARLAERQDMRTLNLAEFAVEGHIGLRLAEESERLVNAEMQAVVRFDGRDVPYRSAPVLIQNQEDRRVRLEWDRAHRRVMESLNPLYAELWARTRQIAAELGFTDYRSMCDELKRLQLDWLRGAAEEILRATAAGWPERVAGALRSVGASAEDGTAADISHFMRARRFDGAFPAERLLGCLKETLAGLGIRMEEQANLHLDIEDRPLKSPRAFCAPVRVPQEVWLVIKPHGGQDDYNSLLHEAGHAEHFTHVDPALPFALRSLGDTSVTETYAFLFNNLLFNERWLTGHLGERDWSEFLEFNRFCETWMLRRYCAKLLYELEMHSLDEERARALYEETLGRHLLVRISPERFLADVDEGFYVAQYLRAWILEAQLRARLEGEFGPEWFRRPAAGEMLKGLWRLGDSLDAPALALKMGADGLSPEPLIRALTRN